MTDHVYIVGMCVACDGGRVVEERGPEHVFDAMFERFIARSTYFCDLCGIVYRFPPKTKPEESST